MAYDYDEPREATAVHPVECGCPTCETGESLPLDSLNLDDLISLLNGRLANETGYALKEFTTIADGEHGVTGVVMPWKRARFEELLKELAD